MSKSPQVQQLEHIFLKDKKILSRLIKEREWEKPVVTVVSGFFFLDHLASYLVSLLRNQHFIVSIFVAHFKKPVEQLEDW